MNDLVQSQLQPVWKVDNKISFGVIILILGQTFAGAWWAGNITTEIDHLKKAVEQGMINRYTSTDAARDFRLVDQRFSGIESYISRHRERHEKIKYPEITP